MTIQDPAAVGSPNNDTTKRDQVVEVALARWSPPGGGESERQSERNGWGGTVLSRVRCQPRLVGQVGWIGLDLIGVDSDEKKRDEVGWNFVRNERGAEGGEEK